MTLNFGMSGLIFAAWLAISEIHVNITAVCTHVTRSLTVKCKCLKMVVYQDLILT